jgi:phosphoribosyl 1,2-cyclic phosphodiesterase
MTYRVISSSSNGNAILFGGEVLIDCGVSFNNLKEHIGNIKYVLLTHIHGDHINLTTVRKLTALNHKIIFLGGAWIKAILPPQIHFKGVEAGQVYRLDNGWLIAPVTVYHDVPNFGYRIMLNGYKHLHITDTYTLDGIEARDYNSATIECNHELVKASELIQEAEAKGEFTHLKRALNSHLSVDKAVEFVKKNNIKSFTPCHIGNSTKKEVLEVLTGAGYEYSDYN